MIDHRTAEGKRAVRVEHHLQVAHRVLQLILLRQADVQEVDLLVAELQEQVEMEEIIDQTMDQTVHQQVHCLLSMRALKVEQMEVSIMLTTLKMV